VAFPDNGSSPTSSALQPRSVVHGLSESLCAAQVPLGGLDGQWPSRNWICSNSPPAAWQRRAHVRRQSCGASFWNRPTGETVQPN